MCALFATSCRSAKQTSEALAEEASLTSREVSRSEVVTRRETAPVKSDTAGLRLSTTSLTDLPLGASYVAKSGRASVRLTAVGQDSIEAVATCDSLLQVVEIMERQLLNLRADSVDRQWLASVREASEKRSGGVSAWVWIALGAVLTLLVLRLLRELGIISK
jgi:hypothetical protein